MDARKQNTSRFRQKLERRILYGLICEWGNAVAELPKEWRVYLKEPVFSLCDAQKRLGSWSHFRNEIRLSREFVINHPWDSVCDVLKHEIAHQAASQVLNAWNEPPHGPSFQLACKLLRADPAYSGSYIPLHERLDEENLSEDEKILKRIKKLLALAESSNQHEAEAAMLKAHNLIDKYNVDLMADRKKRNYISVFVGKPALRHRREEYMLDRLLQDFYYVYGIWISAYVVEKERMGRVLEISGAPQNVKIASYVYDFVMHFIDSEWARYNKGKKLNRYRKTDFAVGIISGFMARLKDQQSELHQARSSSEKALVLAEDAQLDHYVNFRYPRRGKIRRGGAYQDEDVLNDGVQIGKKLIIHKGIHSSDGNSGKMIQ